MGLCKKVMVGIFSRESDETYQWLIDQLLSPQFRSVVQDVRTVLVSNTVCGHSAQLAQEINKCNFAILYHTKKRGRLNVTDVTDSLYDQELRHLSEKLGREWVIVLVDDVETDDSEVYNQMLHDQPLINQLSGLLIVMNKDEKSQYDRSEGSGTYQQGMGIHSKEKIEKILAKIKKGNNVLIWSFQFFSGRIGNIHFDFMFNFRSTFYIFSAHNCHGN
ncbi:uncharacterized protein [Aquarana catesbeiana]|uniref:uncharacterized protein n=1 Tax=Aquarana catesbeiana TaxID=8400 RepID=UPI003CC97743